MALIIALGGALLTALFIPAFLELCRGAAWVRPNLRGRTLPATAGLAPVFGAVTTGVLGALAGVYPPELALELLGVLAGFALAGLVDDLAGQSGARGWRGHARQFLKGRLSSGGFKVLMGGVVALGVAQAAGGNGWEVLTAALLIVTGAATANQLDTRPGWAAGAVLVAVAVSALVGGPRTFLAGAPLAGAVVAYLPHDLGARCMLGDTGANALGAGVGLVLAQLVLPRRLAALAALFVLHLLAELTSVRALVGRLGRSREPGPE